MLTNIFTQKYEHGLREVTLIHLPTEMNEDYRQRIKETSAHLEITMEFFNSQPPAESWILDQAYNWNQP